MLASFSFFPSISYDFHLAIAFFSPPWLEFHSRNIAVATGWLLLLTACLPCFLLILHAITEEVRAHSYILPHFEYIYLFIFLRGLFSWFCNSQLSILRRKWRWRKKIILIHNFYLLLLSVHVMAFKIFFNFCKKN